MKKLVVTLTLLFLVIPCQAATIIVDPNGSGDYLTIQESIDAAVDGDTVIVAPGTYTGLGNRDLDFRGKAITVRSTDPNDPTVVAATVIDCNGIEGPPADPHRGFVFHSGEGPDSVLAGLTITNAWAGTGNSGGIRCSSNPTIINCLITGNSAYYNGGGIYCIGCSPTIKHCTITGNTAGNRGGGIFCTTGGSPTITHCTITNNWARYNGGAISANTSNPTVSHCIVWENSPSWYQVEGNFDISYSDVQYGFSGEGNIDADPCFLDAVNGDYHLSANSPCIDAGDTNYIPDCGETDIDGEPPVMGSRTDIGADEFTSTPAPIIGISPTEFEFDANEGGPNPEAQLMSIYNAGNGTFSWQLSEECTWLEVTPTSGESSNCYNPCEIKISIDISGMTWGSYNCKLTIMADEVINSPPTVDVSLVVYGPEIELSAEEFKFFVNELVAHPNDQILTIRNSGGGTLNWVITYDCNWLQVAPDTGRSRGEPNKVTLSVDATGMSKGDYYDCELTISDPNSENSPQTVQVALGFIAGDFEPDGDVDLTDLGFFVSHWLDTGCNDSAGDASDWCFGTDINKDSVVDFYDFAALAKFWLAHVE